MDDAVDLVLTWGPLTQLLQGDQSPDRIHLRKHRFFSLYHGIPIRIRVSYNTSLILLKTISGLPCGSVVKNLPAHAGDSGSYP